MKVCGSSYEKKNLIYEILILFAGIMWGVIGIYVKAIRENGFTSIQISALRWIFSALITFIAVMIYDWKKLKIELRDIWLFALIGIFSSLAMSTFYFMCMELTSIAVSDVLMYTSPIWVMIFSAIFFKEKITAKKYVCIVLAFAGCALVSGVLKGGGKYDFLGIAFGICSGVAYSLYSILGKVVLKKYDKVTLTAYNVIFAAIGALFITDVREVFSLVSINPSSLKYIFMLAALGTAIPFFLYTFALKYVRASNAAVICCIEPVAAAIVSIFIAGESLDIVQIVGIFVIIFSIILLQGSKKDN